jgi:DNA-binding XRE family transcriptional regulator
MARQGQSFNEYLEKFKAESSTDDLEAYEAAYAHFSIANEIIERRKALGLTQNDLALASGVAQPEISRIENGVNNPTLDTLIRLARALGSRVRFVNDRTV